MTLWTTAAHHVVQLQADVQVARVATHCHILVTFVSITFNGDQHNKELISYPCVNTQHDLQLRLTETLQSP